MIWDFIKNSIPWWVYLIGFLAAGGILWVYFGPLIMAIWHRLPNWLQWTIIMIFAVFLSVIYGRNKGFADARKRQKELDAHAVQKRQEIHNEVEHMDAPTVDRELDKWLRDK